MNIFELPFLIGMTVFMVAFAIIAVVKHLRTWTPSDKPRRINVDRNDMVFACCMVAVFSALATLTVMEAS